MNFDVTLFFTSCCSSKVIVFHIFFTIFNKNIGTCQGTIKINASGKAQNFFTDTSTPCSTRKNSYECKWIRLDINNGKIHNIKYQIISKNEM